MLVKRFFGLLAFTVFLCAIVLPIDCSGADLKTLVIQLEEAKGDSSRLNDVITSLVSIGPKSVPELVKVLDRSTDGNTKADILLALGNIGGEAAQKAIIQRLTDQSGLVRYFAGYVLWEGNFDHSKMDKKTLLDAAFEFFFHSEFIASLAGFKPVSVVNGFKALEFENLMGSAIEQELITNKDIGWFFGSDRRFHVIHFYSKTAMFKLLQNADLMSLLERHGFPRVTSVDDAILKFIQYWHGKIPVSQESFDVISGIFFGYPKEDVIAYAKSRVGGKKAAGLDYNYFPDHGREIFFGWLVVSAGHSEELLHLVQNSKNAVDIYHRAAKNGLSGLEIVNQWHSFKCSQIFNLRVSGVRGLEIF